MKPTSNIFCRAGLTILALVVFILFNRAAVHAGTKELPKDVTRVPLVFAGGHETGREDRGRPVVLIAAALGVTPEVFRDAFSRVHPAGPGRGPTDAEARENKAALMDALGKHGITNERLDAVSDYYRYPPGRGSLWKTKPATGNALVQNGIVIGYEILDGGAGYSAPPTVTVPGFENASANVKLSFGQDLQTNGAVSEVQEHLYRPAPYVHSKIYILPNPAPPGRPVKPEDLRAQAVQIIDGDAIGFWDVLRWQYKKHDAKIEQRAGQLRMIVDLYHRMQPEPPAKARFETLYLTDRFIYSEVGDYLEMKPPVSEKIAPYLK